MPEPVGHRGEGDVAGLPKTARRRHHRTLAGGDRRQFGDHPALPDARLSGHHRDLVGSIAGPVPQLDEPSDLEVAADQPGPGRSRPPAPAGC